MNEIFKNTHVFVEVLSMARCDAVQQWDEGAFEKAYKWASYFEEASVRNSVSRTNLLYYLHYISSSHIKLITLRANIKNYTRILKSWVISILDIEIF